MQFAVASAGGWRRLTFGQTQVDGPDVIVLTQGQRALEDILQFTHVTGKPVGAQRRERVGGQVRHLDPEFRALLGQEMRDQQANVVAPFTQRRHVEFNHVDTVVEVLAEFAACNQLCQLPMGGTENAAIDRHLGVGTDGTYALFLDRPQQFDLHMQRQLGDFVKEQGAAVGGLK